MTDAPTTVVRKELIGLYKESNDALVTDEVSLVIGDQLYLDFFQNIEGKSAVAAPMPDLSAVLFPSACDNLILVEDPLLSLYAYRGVNPNADTVEIELLEDDQFTPGSSPSN
jgi:hypothetical protein